MRTYRQSSSIVCIEQNHTIEAAEDTRSYPVSAIETTEQCWRVETDDGVASSPSVAGEIVYVGSEDGNLYALDLENGQERWRFQAQDEISASPAIADGVVYFGDDEGTLYAIQ